MSVTKANVQDLLKSYNEALQYWSQALTTDELTKVKSAQVSSPLEELSKLCKLIKAHTTKVGIIFGPEGKGEAKTAYDTLQKLSESTVLLVSVTAQLTVAELSQIFYEEILNGVNEILKSAMELATELQDQEDDDAESKNQDGRLVSVGKVWSGCDALSKVVAEGKLGVLRKKFKQSIDMIEDGLEEFEEWAENPEEEEDPFGFDDEDFTDDEQDNDADSLAEPSKEEQQTKDEVTAFSKTWVARFKLVKLLFTSVTKSLPSVTKGTTIDDIHQGQKRIAKLIDEMVVELMMGCKVSKAVEEVGSDIEKECNKLLKVVKEVNKSSESKVKWCDSWKEKWDA